MASEDRMTKAPGLHATNAPYSELQEGAGKVGGYETLHRYILGLVCWTESQRAQSSEVVTPTSVASKED